MVWIWKCSFLPRLWQRYCLRAAEASSAIQEGKRMVLGASTPMLPADNLLKPIFWFQSKQQSSLQLWRFLGAPFVWCSWTGERHVQGGWPWTGIIKSAVSNKAVWKYLRLNENSIKLLYVQFLNLKNAFLVFPGNTFSKRLQAKIPALV